MSDLQDEKVEEQPTITFTPHESQSESQSETLSLPTFSETERNQMEEWLKNMNDSLMSSIKPSYTPKTTMPPEVNFDNTHIDWDPEELIAQQTAAKQAYAWSKLQKKHPKAYLIKLANINPVIMERVMRYGFD
jgi:LAS superfamily LD-carboxypeptidase LdcB